MSVAVKQQVIDTGYRPRPIQSKLHLECKRFSVIVCHRRFGKTVWSINHMIDRGLRNPLKNPRYAYLAPLYSQAKRVAWDYLKEYTGKIPGAVINEADLRVDIARPGMGDVIRFTLLGAENPASLKGIYLDGVILDEYAEMNPSTWRETIRPTLSDRSGWAIFIGTPKGRNSFWELYDRATNGRLDPETDQRKKDPEWFAALYRASETEILSKAELESAKAEMTEEEYEQEYECSFQAGLVGAYYTKEIAAAEKDSRIGIVPFDPALPVNTYWDLGINDVMAIWVAQRLGNQHRLIDYLEGPDVAIPEWLEQLRQKKYLSGTCVLPHDAKARDITTGKSREESFRAFGVKYKVLERLDPMDGIHAVRLIFNKCWFDAVRCKRGLDALRQYQRKWDSKSLVFSTKPMHNWASNGADAFRAFALGVSEHDEVNPRSLPTRCDYEYDPFD